MKNYHAVGLLALAVALPIASCSPDEKRDADKTPSSRINRDAPQVILAMPDDYSNVAEKCDGHGFRVFVTTHNGGHSTGLRVMADPTCR